MWSGRPSDEHFWIPAFAGMSGIVEYCEREIVDNCVNRLAALQERVGASPSRKRASAVKLLPELVA
jgi:hypothetical protein